MSGKGELRFIPRSILTFSSIYLAHGQLFKLQVVDLSVYLYVL
jgi:hypothetical protein